MNNNSKIGGLVVSILTIGVFLLILPPKLYSAIILIAFIVCLLLGIALSARGRELFWRGNKIQSWEIRNKSKHQSEKQEKDEWEQKNQKAENRKYDEPLKEFQQILLQQKEISISEMAMKLNMKKIVLFEKLIKWSEQIPFTIIKDKIVVTDLNKFIEQLDQQFHEWDKNESIKSGKIITS